jgi:hypothetical protein
VQDFLFYFFGFRRESTKGDGGRRTRGQKEATGKQRKTETKKNKMLKKKTGNIGDKRTKAGSREVRVYVLN